MLLIMQRRWSVRLKITAAAQREPLMPPRQAQIRSQILSACRYIMTGNSAVIVHTGANPGGELSARPAASTDMSMMASGSMMHGRRLLL